MNVNVSDLIRETHAVRSELVHVKQLVTDRTVETVETPSFSGHSYSVMSSTAQGSEQKLQLICIKHYYYLYRAGVSVSSVGILINCCDCNLCHSIQYVSTCSHT